MSATTEASAAADVASRSLPPAPARRGRALTDTGAVVLAVATFVGAWLHRPVPVLVGLAVAGVALMMRRPALLVVAGALLGAGLGARAWNGMEPVTAAAYEGPATLVSDPEPLPYGTTVDVRVDHRRMQLEASGAAAGALTDALAGERVRVEGRMRPPPPHAPWLVPRHVVGRLKAKRLERIDGGAAPWRAANRLRRLLARGAAGVPEPTRSLYAGFVLGDDRGQTPEVVDDFRGAGLTHLLVVSGQNVAFVLVLAKPLSSRLRLGGRWAVTVGVIGAFGVVTRFEPSVLRASAMAVLAVSATLAGRPASTVRILALSVAALVLIDPLLVRSVGFQLSVGASAGIALLAARVAARIRGPSVLAEGLGVTIAAQLGVAPVLVPRFGGLPVVALVANVLAVPVAGLVTTWGLPAGVAAGLGGPRLAAIVHLPTRLLVAWVASVARVSASLPLGELHMSGLVLATGAGFVAAVLSDRRPSWVVLRRAAACVAAAALLTPALILSRPPQQVALAGGGQLHRGGGATVLLLGNRPRAADLLQDLRRAGVRRLDLVVTAGSIHGDLARALRHRWTVGPLIDASSGATTATVGTVRVTVDKGGNVTVAKAPPIDSG